MGDPVCAGTLRSGHPRPSVRGGGEVGGGGVITADACNASTDTCLSGKLYFAEASTAS